METFASTDDVRHSARRTADDAGVAAGHVKNAATAEINNLIADVEDLLARIADLKDSDVARVRGQVEKAVHAAKVNLSVGADTLRRQAQRVADTADDFVHDKPWQAIGVAALVGAVVGIVAARRS